MNVNLVKSHINKKVRKNCSIYGERVGDHYLISDTAVIICVSKDTAKKILEKVPTLFESMINNDMCSFKYCNGEIFKIGNLIGEKYKEYINGKGARTNLQKTKLIVEHNNTKIRLFSNEKGFIGINEVYVRMLNISNLFIKDSSFSPVFTDKHIIMPISFSQYDVDELIEIISKGSFVRS